MFFNLVWLTVAATGSFIKVARATQCPAPTLTATQFSKLSLDYIIIGSGAAGLTLANRLSEDSNVHVGLIEAGVFHQDDPLIDVPAFGGQIFGNATYDWLFQTVPQAAASGRIIQETRGKMLGGSTGINLMAWDRASSLEYDAWATFADSNDWSFDSLFPYFIKSENIDLTDFDKFPGVSSTEAARASTSFKVDDGFSGPIQASYNTIYGDLVLPLTSTWNSLGVPTNPNTIGGNSSGVRNERTAVGNGVRSYAASAYYCHASTRKNLHVITGAQATKVTFSERPSAGGLLKANGVSFVSRGVTYTANALREVILSAGAVQTPQLLELSGIGDKKILQPLGIDTLVDLPGVGGNLQDHIYTISQFVALPNITTFDPLRFNQAFLEEQTAIYDKNHTGFLAVRDSNLVFLRSSDAVFPQEDVVGLISELHAALSSRDITALQREQYKIQLQWLQEGSVPQVEYIAKSNGLINPANDTKYLVVMQGLLHPLSRGTIHINDTDPLAHPVIDPKYLSFSYDLHSLRSFTNIGLEVVKHQPIAGLLTAQQFPPPDALDTASLESYVTSSFVTGDHLSGTAAMASRALGGVVDANLVVYGTSNLRVVDASIIPLQIGAHLQASVYAIGEKAADIIKSGRRG